MSLVASHRAAYYLVATLLAAALGCARDDSNGVPPALQLLNLDNQWVDLWQRPGRVTAFVFTRSDCPISNRCAPEVRRLCESYRDRAVDFYLVYVDPAEEPDAIRRHVKEYGYPCAALRDPRHALVAYCKATTTPEVAVFDGEHRLAYLGRIDDLYSEVGSSRPQATTHDLENAIESILTGKPVASPRTEAVGCPIADLAS